MVDKAERERFIKERLNLEESTAEALTVEIRQAVVEFLKREKGYSDENIEADRRFTVAINGKEETTYIDFIVNFDGKRLIAIKCSPCSLESRERHILAFSRVVESYQIPISVVTNGSAARVLDTVSGKLVSEDINSMPSKSELSEMLSRIELKQYPLEKLDGEKRILLAFDNIKCSIIDF